MSATDWIARRRELLAEFLKPYRGKRHDNVGLSILAMSDLPRALDALKVVLIRCEDFDANGNSRQLGDPTADTWHKAARIIRDAIESALRADS